MLCAEARKVLQTVQLHEEEVREEGHPETRLPEGQSGVLSGGPGGGWMDYLI